MKNEKRKFFLSMPEVEESVKKELKRLRSPRRYKLPLKMKLLKQQVYTEIVSVWEIDGELMEVTQTSQGKYLIYKLSEDELKTWDDYSHFSGELSDKSGNVGEETQVLTGEWGEHCEK